jgi:hypothetical protein
MDFLNNTIGYPPRTHVSDSEIINSMPVIEVQPCKPYFQSGLTLFAVFPDWERYESILRNIDGSFSVPSKPLRFAYMADSLPSDSFTNEYGETFLQKMTDVASQGIGDLVQITGSRDIFEALGKTGQGIIEAGEAVGGVPGELMKQGGGMAMSAGVASKNFIRKMEESDNSLRRTIGGGLMVAKGLASNHRVDFPMVWRNSAFTPSYSLTIRLWNPNPSKEESTLKYIIYPLAIILSLALPATENGFTFNYPFFHTVVSKGLFSLDPAVITNVTVTKGGDQHQVGHNQRLGLVDVRIDFAGLFTSMVLEEKGRVQGSRPTLRKYLDNLRESKYSSSRKLFSQLSAVQSGISQVIDIPQELFTNKQMWVTEEKPSPEVYKARVESDKVVKEAKLTSQKVTKEVYPEPDYESFSTLD